MTKQNLTFKQLENINLKLIEMEEPLNKLNDLGSQLLNDVVYEETSKAFSSLAEKAFESHGTKYITALKVDYNHTERVIECSVLIGDKWDVTDKQLDNLFVVIRNNRYITNIEANIPLELYLYNHMQYNINLEMQYDLVDMVTITNNEKWKDEAIQLFLTGREVILINQSVNGYKLVEQVYCNLAALKKHLYSIEDSYKILLQSRKVSSSTYKLCVDKFKDMFFDAVNKVLSTSAVSAVQVITGVEKPDVILYASNQAYEDLLDYILVGEEFRVLPSNGEQFFRENECVFEWVLAKELSNSTRKEEIYLDLIDSSALVLNSSLFFTNDLSLISDKLIRNEINFII